MGSTTGNNFLYGCMEWVKTRKMIRLDFDFRFQFEKNVCAYNDDNL